MGFRDRIRSAGQRALLEAGTTLTDLAKASPDSLVTDGKPAGPGELPQEAAREPEAMQWDPFTVIEQLGYKDKPSNITYGTLKSMTWRTPLVSGIIQTRCNQVAAFASPQPDRYATGFRVRPKDRDGKMSKAAKKWAMEMEQLLMTTGRTNNPMQRDSMETFLRKWTWDTLTYDQMCAEIVPDRRGLPAEWYAVDASTIRLADAGRLYYDDKDSEAIKTVQIYDGTVVSEFTGSEMAFAVRNPRTELRLQGYGTSELEMLVNAITSYLWGFEYNQRFFSQGSATKGILNFKGAVPEKQLRAFRRHWYQMVSGVENSWRTPVVNADDLQWISLQQTNRDMEFSAWLDFLIKLICGVYGMDPMEVNFKYGTEAQKSLFESSNKDRITASRDRGLKPLLRFLARNITRYIVEPLNPDFCFEFGGLDIETPKEMADLNTTLVKSTRTIDEIRAQDGLKKLPEGKGEVILDPSWMNFVQQKEAQAMEAEQQAAMAEQGGGEGEAGPEGGEPEEAEGPMDVSAFVNQLAEGGGEEEPTGKSLHFDITL